VLGWQQKVEFKQLIEMMVDADLERLSARPFDANRDGLTVER